MANVWLELDKNEECTFCSNLGVDMKTWFSSVAQLSTDRSPRAAYAFSTSDLDRNEHLAGLEPVANYCTLLAANAQYGFPQDFPRWYANSKLMCESRDFKTWKEITQSKVVLWILGGSTGIITAFAQFWCRINKYHIKYVAWSVTIYSM
jgi:hypothetical protein